MQKLARMFGAVFLSLVMTAPLLAITPSPARCSQADECGGRYTIEDHCEWYIPYVVTICCCDRNGDGIATCKKCWGYCD